MLEEVKAWQTRPLEAVYPIVYLDALFVSIRDGGRVTKKAVYIALGVGLDGSREDLGFWIQATEGARFWLDILTELKNRGVEDIFFGLLRRAHGTATGNRSGVSRGAPCT